MNNSKTIYQVTAQGFSVNGWKFKMRSKAVFSTSKEAEVYKQEFEELCRDISYFDYAVGKLNIKIIELEYYE